MLQKIIDCESLENLPENVYDGVCFKVASLCCTNCISTITRRHHIFFFRICSKNCMPGSTTEVSLRGLQESSLQNFVKVSARYLCHSLSNKVTGLQSIGCNFAENEVFDKNKNYLLTLVEIIVIQKAIFIFECRCPDANAEISKWSF